MKYNLGKYMREQLSHGLAGRTFLGALTLYTHRRRQGVFTQRARLWDSSALPQP